jgi:hypothetical protein
MGRVVLLRPRGAGVDGKTPQIRTLKEEGIRMRLRLLFGSSILLLLGGCAGMTTSSLSADHPANPAAALAPMSPPSQTLAVNDASLADPVISPAQLKPEMGGMQHDMKGMKDMGGMQHDMKGMHHGNEMSGMQHEAPATQPGENAALSAPRWTPTTLPATTRASVYTCKMHPEVISNAPGKCPKCGMKLVIKGAP